MKKPISDKRKEAQRLDNLKRYRAGKEAGLVDFRRRVTPEVMVKLVEYYNKLLKL